MHCLLGKDSNRLHVFPSGINNQNWVTAQNSDTLYKTHGVDEAVYTRVNILSPSVNWYWTKQRGARSRKSSLTEVQTIFAGRFATRFTLLDYSF